MSKRTRFNSLLKSTFLLISLHPFSVFPNSEIPTAEVKINVEPANYNYFGPTIGGFDINENWLEINGHRGSINAFLGPSPFPTAILNGSLVSYASEGGAAIGSTSLRGSIDLSYWFQVDSEFDEEVQVDFDFVVFSSYWIQFDCSFCSATASASSRISSSFERVSTGPLTRINTESYVRSQGTGFVSTNVLNKIDFSLDVEGFTFLDNQVHVTAIASADVTVNPRIPESSRYAIRYSESFQKVSAIPEAPTYFLFSLGLVAIVLGRKFEEKLAIYGV